MGPDLVAALAGEPMAALGQRARAGKRPAWLAELASGAPFRWAHPLDQSNAVRAVGNTKR